MTTGARALAETTISAPHKARRLLEQLQGRRAEIQKARARRLAELEQVTAYLRIAPLVGQALDKLSEQLFGQIVQMLEEKLTIALQEVLEQPITLKVEREFKRGGVTMSFHVERNGEPEDIMRGQGGSVANVLSVGLRLFALTTLDSRQHRRFLVLDEQDCWLRPDLVPRLARIVHDAGKALGFQVIMISHHDMVAFTQHADAIYRFTPTPTGVLVQRAMAGASDPDRE
jgi:DNA repair exonuclease SbcCD ATPase subunit